MHYLQCSAHQLSLQVYAVQLLLASQAVGWLWGRLAG